MNETGRIPADRFLDQVIGALMVSDAATLRELEAAAPNVAAPVNGARYRVQRAALDALLAATARNLRFLNRVAGRRLPDGYDQNQ